MHSKSLKDALARWAFYQHAGEPKHIDRWRRHPSTEDDWAKIERSAWRAGRPIEPREFIRTVLDARHEVKFNGREFRRKQAEIFAAEKLRILKHAPKVTRSAAYPFALASALERAAAELRGAFGCVISSDLIEPSELNSKKEPTTPGLLVVIDMRNSVDRRSRSPMHDFMKAVSNYLLAHCRRSFDKEVATLTEIAFALRDATVTVDKVRAARGRPTTRSARARKR
jgi:hypothetical protein